MAPHHSTQLSDEKRALRRAMTERRDALPPDERRRRSQAAADNLLALPEWARALARAAAGAGVIVAGYVAFRGEIDPAPLMQAARAGGAAVALPRLSGGAPRMRFHRVDAGAALVPGPWGLLEPEAVAPEVAPESIDLMVVPGLAFDPQGWRLGYGKGHYDEVAGAARAGARVGLAYDFQIVDRCPAGEGDMAVDLVVTDRRVLRPAPGGRA
jgi:5-formyltetrahydrofolate cyclo-ligase